MLSPLADNVLDKQIGNNRDMLSIDNDDNANTLNKKKLLFVLRHAPYGSSLTKEAIDAILATSVYEQVLSVVFMDDGVLALTKDQHSEQIEQKNIAKMLSAFPMYDISRLFVCATSLDARGIDANAIDGNFTILAPNELQQLLQQQDHLLSF
ncbi:sulfurtransferase complex subunit TusC [Eionea flava]